MPKRSGRDQTQQTEWHGECKAASQMSAGARIASAFHPTDLMAKGAKERAGDQHVVYNVMREHDIVAGRPNQISKHKIIRVIVGFGGATPHFLPGLAVRWAKRP